MDIQKTTQKVRDHIAKGETEKAISALVNYTKINQSLAHDNALLLSGQFRQWKREDMLGVEQSDNELRRIEMSILSVLKNINASNTTQKPAVQTVNTSRQAAVPVKSKFLLLAAGMLSLIAIIAIIIVMTRSGNEAVTENPAAAAAAAVPSGISVTTACANEKRYLIYSSSFLSKGNQLDINECLISNNQKYALIVTPDNLHIIKLNGTIRGDGNNNFADPGTSTSIGNSFTYQPANSSVIVYINNN